MKKRCAGSWGVYVTESLGDGWRTSGGFVGRWSEEVTKSGESSIVFLLCVGLWTGFWSLRKRCLQVEAERNVLWQNSVRHWVPVRVTTGFRGKTGCRASLCKDGAHMAQGVSLIRWRQGLMEGCQTPSNFWQGVWGHVWSGQERTKEMWLRTMSLANSKYHCPLKCNTTIQQLCGYRILNKL